MVSYQFIYLLDNQADVGINLPSGVTSYVPLVGDRVAPWPAGGDPFRKVVGRVFSTIVQGQDVQFRVIFAK